MMTTIAVASLRAVTLSRRDTRRACGHWRRSSLMNTKTDRSSVMARSRRQPPSACRATRGAITSLRRANRRRNRLRHRTFCLSQASRRSQPIGRQLVAQRFKADAADSSGLRAAHRHIRRNAGVEFLILVGRVSDGRLHRESLITD